MQLGRKIRDLRLRRGLTVQRLAEASGLSKGFISQVENDRTSPSLATLADLARSLETSVAYLVVEEEPQPHVVRADERPHVLVGGNTSRVELLSARPKRNLELLMAELPPGLSAGNKRHYHHGEEIVVCLEGRVSLVCGELTTVLGCGDSCHFDGRTPHAVENVGTSTARVLIAVTPAAFEPLIRVVEEVPHVLPETRVPEPAID
ncbi:MAG TPA: cupin domain-containing protein [Candidatus Saccharimonadaceae bacterium]|jgi:transcriptional regulator with XRE-family HTH domain|nr:cupin domain-containing protein [Candidatus Saccharimonadaceae bacterium]